MVVPLLAFGGGFFSMGLLSEVSRTNPGLVDLSRLLRQRTSGWFSGGKPTQAPTDRQLAIYILHHYRGMITNQATWSNPWALSLINGERRAFVEKSLAEYPAPTEAQIADADAAVAKFLPRQDFFADNPPLTLSTRTMLAALLPCACLPALLAALAFRGGLLLLIAGVTFVRKDGQPASRMRVLWRALLAWIPLFCACGFAMSALDKQWVWGAWTSLALAGLLAAWSVALPERGLQDRLAGTWPVPR